MSILSDAEIEARCLLPDMVLDERAYRIKMNQARVTTLIHYEDPIHYQAEQQAYDDKVRLACMRAPTADERAAFSPMITPYSPLLVRQVADARTKIMGTNLVTIPTNLRKVISYGTSSYGYDIRLSDHVEIFTNINSTVIDPKRFDPSKNLVKAMVHTDEDGALFVIMPPNSYLLGHTVETFHFPRDVTALFIGKSTYARVGIIVNCTPGEAGWKGILVIEISNSTPSPVKIYVNEGIAQALFFKGEKACKVSYADRGGKYQNQTGLTHAKV